MRGLTLSRVLGNWAMKLAFSVKFIQHKFGGIRHVGIVAHQTNDRINPLWNDDDRRVGYVQPRLRILHCNRSIET